MKNYLFILLTIITLQIGYTQLCPQNTIPGSTIDDFDWTTVSFEMWLTDEFQQNYHAQVVSPFHIVNNSSQVNTDHFAETLEKDFEANDGWEVVFVDFGKPQKGVLEPSFALYNRHSGLFRFFMYITSSGTAPYNGAYISTYIDQLGPEFKNSALFESHNGIHHSLENFDKEINIASVNRYHEGKGSWIVAEWLTHYDPCTCASSMELVFQPKLQNIEYMTMESDATSENFPGIVFDKYAPGYLPSISLASMGDQIELISGTYESGNETYPGLYSFTNTLNKISDISAPDNEYKSPDILKKLSIIALQKNKVDLDNSSTSLLSIVNTFATTTSSKTINAYSKNHIFKHSEDLKLGESYQATKFYIPGSDHSNYLEEKKPIYDNILGVASIVKTPQMDFLQTEEIEIDDCPGGHLSSKVSTYKYYKMNADISYAINTNAGINPLPKDAKVAMYFDVTGTDCNSSTDNENSIISYFLDGNPALIKVNSNKYRTPYMNLSCLKNYPVEIFTNYDDGCSNNDCYRISVSPYLSFALVLESNNHAEIGYLKSYHIQKNIPTYSWDNKPENMLLGIPEQLEYDYESDIDPTQQAWGPIIVNNAKRKEVETENPDGSTSIFTIEAEDATTGYETNAYTVDCGEVLPMSYNEIQSFCQSNAYNPLVTANRPDMRSSHNEETKIKFFPNPTSKLIHFDLEYVDHHQFEIRDVMGKLLIADDIKDEALNLQNLPRGIYMLRILKNRKMVQDEKIIKL